MEKAGGVANVNYTLRRNNRRQRTPPVFVNPLFYGHTVPGILAIPGRSRLREAVETDAPRSGGRAPASIRGVDDAHHYSPDPREVAAPKPNCAAVVHHGRPWSA